MLSCTSQNDSTNFLIIEIVSNSSNSEDDIISDDTANSLYAYLSVLLSESNNIDESKLLITENYNNIDYIITEKLSEKNISYIASIELTTLERDYRQCGNIVLNKGSYQTLLITLGEGNGNTNWSIAYPSLTYVEGENGIILKSRINEIVKENK
jgi:stage II sporulation protein R